MDKSFTAFKGIWAQYAAPRWVRIASRVLLGLFIALLAAYFGIAWYINTHKKEVLAGVVAELNENLDGTLTIGNMEPALLQAFPLVSLRLENVVLRDSLYESHKHTLLNAGELSIALNALALLQGTISIKKVTVSDASIDLFTDTRGYRNTSVFRKKKRPGNSDGGGFPELRRIRLENVSLTVDNRKMEKLHKFDVKSLDGSITYMPSGWKADASLKAIARSMAFNTQKGSFIKDKMLEGKFDAEYEEDKGYIDFKPRTLIIGGEKFTVGARIATAGVAALFTINIKNEALLWDNAAKLLSPNIAKKLTMFSLKEPIAVTCKLQGDFNVRGEPLIQVRANIKDNELNTPGGLVKNCSFTGVFTNNYIKSKGFNDPNSAIKLYDFKGEYAGIPFLMKKTYILDLKKPVALGGFTAKFGMQQLGGIIDKSLLAFNGGTADVRLNFKAPVVNFKLTKPLVGGIITIKDTDVRYVPRKLDFKDVSVALNFNNDDLHISEILLKSGKSVVSMEGSIKNFLNLYYTDPNKVVLTWQVNSPRLHLGDFMGFLGSRQHATATITGGTGNFTAELNELFDKSNVDMKLRVDRLYYKRFYADNAKADILLTDSGIILKNVGLNHAGGSVALNGSLLQQGKTGRYNLNAAVKNVDISRFLAAFDNFGMQALRAENLKGRITSGASIQGRVTDAGAMVPGSMAGSVSFSVKKGRLVNFEPVRNVGRFAFPFRDMDNIEFYGLNGRFDINGERVTIHPMKINSSVLNMDVEGVYSFGKGTEIYIDVPLRNPKKDKNITDEKELDKRRNRGIVLHLKAEDDKDGKVKVKLGGKKD